MPAIIPKAAVCCEAMVVWFSYSKVGSVLKSVNFTIASCKLARSQRRTFYPVLQKSGTPHVLKRPHSGTPHNMLYKSGILHARLQLLAEACWASGGLIVRPAIVPVMMVLVSMQSKSSPLLLPTFTNL